MADNVAVTPGAGATIATDDVAGVQYQRVKLDLGGDGAASPLLRGQQAAANSLPVTLPSDQGALAVTIGATVTVDGSGVTQPISAAVLPLPSGAATVAKQPALGTAGTASADVLTVQGIAAMTALKVDGSAVTQPVSGTVELGATALAALETITVSGTVTANLAAGTNTNEVVGDAAHDAAIAGNPVRVGARAVSADYTAVADGDTADLICDLNGKLVTMPYSIPENTVSGVTAAMTGTGDTSVIAAAGAGLRNYITSLMVTNSHATTGTVVELKDGTTVIWRGYAAPAGGGFAIAFPKPLRGTANTAVNAANVTTASNTYVCAAGFKAP